MHASAWCKEGLLHNGRSNQNVKDYLSSLPRLKTAPLGAWGHQQVDPVILAHTSARRDDAIIVLLLVVLLACRAACLPCYLCVFNRKATQHGEEKQ
jgi:hypothetical protein